MAFDYHQRKQISRNRPKRRPIKLYGILFLGGFLVVYGMGIGTGWLLFHSSDQNTGTAVVNPAKAGNQTASSAQPSKTTAAKPAAGQAADPNLTFYYTLPQGEKAVMGSGINFPAPEKPAPAKPSPQPAPPAVKQVETTKTTVKEPEPKTEKTPSTSPSQPPAAEKTYTLQVAAYQNKNEAEELKEKLAKNGYSARLEQYAVTGKGTWYRVRIGRRLSKESAEKLATKLGNGVLAIPE